MFRSNSNLVSFIFFFRKLCVEISVVDPDPGSGAFLTSGLDQGWVESQHPDPGSGMNNPDHIF
jgi:hypothetical protein